MAYWILQVLLFLIYISVGYGNSQNEREIYGDAQTLVVYFLSALCFILLTHILLRPLTHNLRKKEKSLLTIIFIAAPAILICSLLASTVQILSKDVLFQAQQKQAYYIENPDQLPQSQLAEVNKKLALIKANRADELTEVQLILEKHQDLSKAKQERKNKNYIKAIKYGLEQRKRDLEDEIDALQAGNTDSSSLLNGLILFLFALWYVFYLFLSAIKNRFQIKTHLKQSQIALLMSQLNPHFLFNSLNSIRGMIFEDKQLAKDLIDKLNELFEYNLTANKHASVKLKEELRICEFYLDIEHIRLEERLAIDMSIDKSCLNYKVPTMGLLTLIENAIKHGIAPRQEPSTLQVNIQKQAEHLIIDVLNPIFKGDYQVHSTGTGQENLLKRLQLMYADDASLETTLSDGSYLATLRIPI